MTVVPVRIYFVSGRQLFQGIVGLPSRETLADV